MNNNLMDVHGAGAQGSDPKTGNPSDYPDYFDPQGDLRYVFNYARCVRDASGSSSVDNTQGNINIKLYPNPTKDICTVNFDHYYSNINIRIINHLGEQTMELEVKNTNQLALN